MTKKRPLKPIKTKGSRIAPIAKRPKPRDSYTVEEEQALIDKATPKEYREKTVEDALERLTFLHTIPGTAPIMAQGIFGLALKAIILLLIRIERNTRKK